MATAAGSSAPKAVIHVLWHQELQSARFSSHGQTSSS